MLAFCEKIAGNIFHLNVHYMCHSMLVQCFELQGRCFTHIHYYKFFSIRLLGPASLLVQVGVVLPKRQLMDKTNLTCILASTCSSTSSSSSQETTNELNKSNTTVTHLHSNNIPLAVGKLC